jgi:FkbM family methyltransferase
MTDPPDSRVSAVIRPGAAPYESTDINLGNGPPRKLYYRKGTTDVDVVQHILVNRQYDLGRLRRSEELKSFLDRKKSTGKSPLIVDAGANIGATTLFFATIVSDANIVAIEPDKENFALLEKNVQGLRVQAICGAVASTRGFARVVDPGIGHWGYRTENIGDGATSDGSVPRLTINEIYRQRAEQCFPFIVKVDIEGGEADLFSSSTEWVAMTPVLIVELHDWLLTKSGNSRAFLRCVSQLDRDFVYIGEDIYSIANDL